LFFFDDDDGDDGDEHDGDDDGDDGDEHDGDDDDDDDDDYGLVFFPAVFDWNNIQIHKYTHILRIGIFMYIHLYIYWNVLAQYR